MEKIGISTTELGWSLNETQYIFNKYASSAEKATYNNMLWDSDTNVAKGAEAYREKIASQYYDEAKKDWDKKVEEEKQKPAIENEKAAEEANNTIDSQGNTPANIQQTEYDKLSDEEKAKWVVVTETAVDPELTAQMSSVGDAQDVINKMQPIQPVYKMLPQPLPGEQLKTLIDTLDKLFKSISPIVALMNVPIIKQLVAPLVKLLNLLFSVIGMMLLILMMVAKGQKLFTDDLCDAVDQVDWDGLDKAAEKYKEKISQTVDNAKQSVSDGIDKGKEAVSNGTQEAKDVIISEESDSDVKRKSYNMVDKAKEKLDSSSKAAIGEAKKELEALKQTVLMANAAAKGVKMYKENVAIFYSSKEQAKKAASVLKVAGVDMSPLFVPSKEQQKAMDKIFPDPTKQVSKVNAAIKKINKPKTKKYTRIEEKKAGIEQDKMCTSIPPQKVSWKEKLTQNYCVGDLCYSNTAKTAKIDNTPPQYIVDNMKLLSEKVIEPIRAHFGSVLITSCYRSPELNEYLAKQANSHPAKSSQHLTGEAVDMVFPKVKAYDAALWIRDNLKDSNGKPLYDQLILEKNSSGSVWVHCSYSKQGCRGKLLTLNKRPPYIPGLKNV